jgi:hypothetical protein
LPKVQASTNTSEQAHGGTVCQYGTKSKLNNNESNATHVQQDVELPKQLHPHLRGLGCPHAAYEGDWTKRISNQNSELPMKKQEQIDALYERMKTAGGFECALIMAYMKADGGNAKLLEDAFKGTRFDLTPKPKFNHGVEVLRNAAYWSGNRDEYLNDDKTAYQIIDEYLNEND